MAELARHGDKNQTRTNPTFRTETSIPVPKHCDLLSISTLKAGTTFHRVHLSKYDATELNPGKAGNARFSPIKDKHGHAIATIYAGTTLQCALMETVFHDVPYTPGLKTLDKNKLTNHVHSKIKLSRSLKLINLGSVALRRLGIARHQLIDTEKELYPETRAWASAIHGLCKQAQGLTWTSRQDDSAHAIMLFGDRLTDRAFESVDESRNILKDGVTYAKVLSLATRIGVDLVTTTQP